MSAPLRKGWCPGALRPMEAKDGLLVRLRLTGGILPAATAHAIADLADRYGNGLFDLTARANLQMRGVHPRSLPAVQDSLQTLGLLDASAAAESVRNVIASPLAGLHGGPDIRPLVARLERRLSEDTALHALPSKFLFLIDDGSQPSLANVEADVRFDWDGARFEVGLGGTRETAVRVGECDGEDLADEAARIAKLFLRLADGRPNVRRMRDLKVMLDIQNLSETYARDPCAAYGRKGPLRNPASAKAEAIFSRKRETVDARDIVGLREIDGVRCLGLAAPFGRLSAAMLLTAAGVAERIALRELRLTPFRAILIPGAAQATALSEFITDPADPRLSVAACVGAAGCACGSTDTHADATALADTLPAAIGVILHVSGCEKGCAKPSPTAVTLVARDGRYAVVRNGRAGDEPDKRDLDLAAARRAIAAEMEPA